MRFGDIYLGYEIPSQTKEITQEKITKNAEASLDFNPIHINPEYCKKINLLGRGTTIAHGMMTLAFMGKLVTDWVWHHGGQLKELNAKFIHPVRPGDTITGKGTVIELHPRKKEPSFVVIDLFCQNQEGTKVSVGTATVTIPD